VTAPIDAEVEDATARLYLAIGRLARLLRRTGSPGLGPGAVSALATLARCGPMRLGDLANKEGVAPPDGRAWLATPTPEGETMVSGVRSARVRELQRRIEQLTPAHVAALVNALDALETLVGEESK